MDSVEAFLAHLADRNTKSATSRAYAADLRHFRAWWDDAVGLPFSPEEVTESTVHEYRRFMHQTAQLKPVTINRRLATLRRFFAWARSEGLSPTDPTADIGNFSLAPSPPRDVSRKELNALTRAAEKEAQGGSWLAIRNLAIIQVLRYTGLRRSEVAALALDDLTLRERSGMLVVRSGKGEKYREVPLNLDVRKALRAYLDVRPEAAGRAVFINTRRQGISEKVVVRAVTTCASRANLEGVTPQTLRHSLARHLAKNGTDLATIADLLGHANINTTFRYTKPSLKDIAEAIDGLGVIST